MDWENLLDQRSSEISKAVKLAESINKKTPDAKVTWKDVIGGLRDTDPSIYFNEDTNSPEGNE